MSDSYNCEKDQVLVPTSIGYRAYNLLNLFGINDRRLRSVQNFGLSPLHFITQRGPQQDGETPLDIRLDPRIIQIVIAKALCDRTSLWDERNDLLDLLRPTRGFNGTVQPLIYRKWLPAGKIERGTDMVVTNASPTVTSDTGRFITRGGLDPGCSIDIAGVTYIIAEVENDYTLILTANYAGGSATDVAWEYRRRHAKRDLYCFLERGPSFDEGPGASPFYPTGYYEALRLIAHDPVWYGPEQSETWTIGSDVGDLVFDGEGAWLGSVAGVGRWLFASASISEVIDVVYWGTDRAVPTIELLGPFTTATVVNQTTGVSITLDYTILATQVVTIDLIALTVTGPLGINLMPYTSGDIALFGLQGEPQAPNRINRIAVSFDSADGNTAAVFKWRNRFVGI